MTVFREVLIKWRDEAYPQGWESRTVGVDGAWNSLDEEDDDVFFWFASEQEYQDCLKNGEGDFEMKEEE